MPRLIRHLLGLHMKKTSKSGRLRQSDKGKEMKSEREVGARSPELCRLLGFWHFFPN